MQCFWRCLAVLLLLGLPACTPEEQAILQTEAAIVQGTVVEKGETFIQTQAAITLKTVETSGKTEVAGLATLKAQATPTPIPIPYQVGAYYYPWYGQDGSKWNEGHSGPPELGLYNSADAGVIQRHIDWAAQYGVNFFAMSWWGPNSASDNVLRDAFLKSPGLGKIQFAILYETPGRFIRDTDGKYDLSNPTNQQTMKSDFAYLQSSYWNNPRYFKLNNKPLVFIYLSRDLKGDLAGVFATLRETARQGGNELYLIGDEVYWRIWYPTDEQRLKLFDGVTAYNMHASTPGIADNFNGQVRQEYLTWQGLARQAGVSFIPGVIPGFDDTRVRPQENHPILPRSETLFQEQLALATQLSDPQLKLLMITSWNEWLEDTAIEPGHPFGLRYLELLQAGLRP